MSLFDRSDLGTMDFRYGRDDIYSPDYKSLWGDGTGTGDARIGGLLGNITQYMGDAMVNDKGLFQGGDKNRMFGRLRDWWEGDEGEPTTQTTPVVTPEGEETSENTGVTFSQEAVEGSDKYKPIHKFPSWHPMNPNNTTSSVGSIYSYPNWHPMNPENITEDVVSDEDDSSVFDYQEPEYDTSSIFEYQEPEYSTPSYVEPTYNEPSYVEPEHNKPNWFDRGGSGKGSNYPFNDSNPAYNFSQSLLGSIPGYETTNPAKVDEEITDNAKVFNSSRGRNWRIK